MAIMSFNGINVYQMKDVGDRMTRLTRWLEPTHEEFCYLEKEYNRILKDRRRSAMVVYWNGQIALFVNDMTGGEFDRLGDESTI